MKNLLIANPKESKIVKDLKEKLKEDIKEYEKDNYPIGHKNSPLASIEQYLADFLSEYVFYNQEDYLYLKPLTFEEKLKIIHRNPKILTRNVNKDKFPCTCAKEMVEVLISEKLYKGLVAYKEEFKEIMKKG